MKKVGVLGRGTMALGIVQVFAQKGYEVVVWVRSIDENNKRASIAPVEKAFGKLVTKEKMSKEDMEKALSLISITTSYDDLKDCDLIIEAISEDMDIKKETFKKLDGGCKKEAILATNTSSLSITEIANATNRPDKVIGMHFFNPVPVMKLIEVIKGIATSEETKKSIFELAIELDKVAVEVEEAPGFVVNRILIPMINEAVGILADGVATAKDIDEAMKLGANHPIGPLALADLIGLDVCLAIMDVLYEEFKDSKYRAHPLLRKMVRGNLLGRKTKKGFFEY
ncbi:3-hydroxybutyryl-CoA dehydrogenase [Soehngenia longivitae]|uniref:3-hydroxybutyryl-CoA dehydrogenase n=1 Tax=Soehngenia longivitae TaxID=2562294 RepID=A0A4Z0D493_9FIRM|nr:3-hydroxybutyryl-CoA dehydrogenase [Soehngenia longivitae]TFZ39656.1 3-hydroxybutyryl-CoA dehydrogenase [Soehngenia longivitae]